MCIHCSGYYGQALRAQTATGGQAGSCHYPKHCGDSTACLKGVDREGDPSFPSTFPLSTISGLCLTLVRSTGISILTLAGTLATEPVR